YKKEPSPPISLGSPHSPAGEPVNSLGARATAAAQERKPPKGPTSGRRGACCLAAKRGRGPNNEESAPKCRGPMCFANRFDFLLKTVKKQLTNQGYETNLLILSRIPPVLAPLNQ